MTKDDTTEPSRSRERKDLHAQLDELRQRNAADESGETLRGALDRHERIAGQNRGERRGKGRARRQPAALLFEDPPGQPKVPPPHVKLEEAVSGVELDGPDGVKSFLVETRTRDLVEVHHIDATFREALSAESGALRQRIPVLRKATGVVPEDFLFMDIETTGLGSSPLFLIGAMRWANGGFEIRQHFARDYSEEAAVIAAFAGACQRETILVTFNGKTFDVPYVRTRAVATGVPIDLNVPHIDLLHVARGVWQGRLPNCKLQTLESRICGRTRRGDIPGNLIPDAYHAYVRTCNAWQMVEVLRHNVLDLVTMADIMTRLPVP